MEKKRIYPSNQLIVALDSKVLKVCMWILGWQSHGSIKYFPRQFAKACKMEEDEVERCIQSLEDARLIDISKVDQTWMITPNAEQFQRYYEVDLSKVLEGKGIGLADKVTWNSEGVQQTKSSTEDIEGMSDDALKSLLLRIEASLNERQQMKKVVVSAAEPNLSDLPF